VQYSFLFFAVVRPIGNRPIRVCLLVGREKYRHVKLLSQWSQSKQMAGSSVACVFAGWQLFLCTFVVVLVHCASPHNQQVAVQRILSEWKDINAEGLSLSTPFNNSAHEVSIQ
jgi:hypothetical protein